MPNSFGEKKNPVKIIVPFRSQFKFKVHVCISLVNYEIWLSIKQSKAEQIKRKEKSWSTNVPALDVASCNHALDLLCVQ